MSAGSVQAVRIVNKATGTALAKQRAARNMWIRGMKVIFYLTMVGSFTATHLISIGYRS
jgi:hypothetical protein